MIDKTSENATSSGSDAPSSRNPGRRLGPKLKALLVIGVVLTIIGLSLNFYFQARMDDKLTLSKDFEHDFTSYGESSYVNLDYLFPYDDTYNGTGTSAALPNYTSEIMTTIEGVDSGDGYVEFSHVKEIVNQPTLIIDVNTGAEPGGVAVLPPMAPGMPSNITFPFGPHQATDSTLYLDAKNWSYRPDVYEANGEPPRTGYARSVLTHHLEQKDYPVYISSIRNLTTAEFGGALDVKGIETYKYSYTYTFQIPFMIYNNETENLTAVLFFTEDTDEFHEPTTGALLKQSTVLTYYVTTVDHMVPDTVEIYAETSDYEISSDDADSFSMGLFWMRNSSTIALALIVPGIALVAAATAMAVRSRKDKEQPPK